MDFRIRYHRTPTQAARARRRDRITAAVMGLATAAFIVIALSGWQP